MNETSDKAGTEQHSELDASLLAAANRRELVIMAGAGVSAIPPTSLPGWTPLNEQIGGALCDAAETYLRLPGYLQDARTAIDLRRRAEGFPPDYQAQVLAESTGNRYFSALEALDVPVENRAHHAIADLAGSGKVAAIVTTNFDQLIEHTLEAHAVPHRVSFEPDTYAGCLQSLQDQGADEVYVLKIHGSVGDGSSMIDTLKQRLLGRNADLNRCLKLLLERYYWLYLGFSAADLETNPSYLGLRDGASGSPGLTYVQWPKEGALSQGATLLVDAYGGKAQVVVAEVDDLLIELARASGALLDSDEPNASDETTGALVSERLAAWARQLHPAAAINCIGGLLEATGNPPAAFQVLHRFWGRVVPSDREGEDFELYRLNHGRLGIGGGLLSVADLDATSAEESLQNLLRTGGAGDPRGDAWAGQAFLWAGNTALAIPLLGRAGGTLDNDELPPETRVDVWLVLAEAMYLLGEPEELLEGVGAALNIAERAGDLPRRAKVQAIAELYHAEFVREDYERIVESGRELFAATERLHDPGIGAFQLFARARHLVIARAAEAAIEPLSRAIESFEVVGRMPWRLLACIEYAKALIDAGQIEPADQQLDVVFPLVERYPLLAVWFAEARGQWNAVLGNSDYAQRNFESAVEYAESYGLTRRAEVLRRYLDQPNSNQ